MPRVSPLISQVAFCSQASGVVFNIADVSEGFNPDCRSRGVVLPGSLAHFVPPFGVFRLADADFIPQRQSRSNRADAQ